MVTPRKTQEMDVKWKYLISIPWWMWNAKRSFEGKICWIKYFPLINVCISKFVYAISDKFNLIRDMNSLRFSSLDLLPSQNAQFLLEGSDKLLLGPVVRWHGTRHVHLRGAAERRKRSVEIRAVGGHGGGGGGSRSFVVHLAELVRVEAVYHSLKSRAKLISSGLQAHLNFPYPMTRAVLEPFYIFPVR